jgi:hypothetical protein
MNNCSFHGVEGGRLFKKTVGKMGVKTFQVLAFHPDPGLRV